MVKATFGLWILAGNLCLAEQAADVGRGAFHLYCAPCHGIKAEGGRNGPDLIHSTRPEIEMLKIIENGIPGTEMPSFSDSLTPETIKLIVGFLHSSVQPAGEPARGDRAKGERLFWGKGSCGQCHVVGVKGIRIGPELTRIGRQRSPAHLRESIVSPNADPSPGYATVTVVTRESTKIVGIEKGLDNFTVQLVDLSQKFYSFDRGDVASVTREQKSLMPDNYGSRLSNSEVDDLVTYLVTLRGMPAQ